MLTNKEKTTLLKHRSELFYNAFQHSTDAILITDLYGNIVETNNAFTHFFGWARDEAAGQNARILRSSKSTDEFYQQIWESIETKGEWKGEIFNMRKDGSEIPVLLSITPIYYEGEKVGYMGFEIDITEKKKIENQLLHEKDFSESLIENANNLVVGLNFAGEIIIFNRKCEEITGYSKQAVLGKNWIAQFIPERLRSEMNEVFDSVRQNQLPFQYENPVLTKMGEERIIAWHNSVLTDSGNIIGTISSGMDVTERKQMEDAIIRSEANLKKAQELAHLGSYELDIPLSSSKDVHWSEETFHIVGRDPSLGEPSLEEYMPTVYSEDQPRLSKALNSAMSDGIPFEIEYSIFRPDGSVRHILSIGEPILDKKGKIVKLVGTLLDITERKKVREALKESESRIRAIVDTAVDGIITIDEKGIVQSFNSAVERLFGYTIDEVKGQNITILIPPPSQQKHDNYMRNYLKTGKKKIIGIGREVIGQRKDGSTFPLYLAVSEFFLGDRRMFTGIVHDRTKQKQLQKKILQSERLATIGQMAAKVAHEIRNPLSSISLNAELLVDELRSYKSVNTSEANALLESIISEVERVTALTEEYLQFSRLPESRPIKGNIEEAIKDMMEIVQHELSQNNIEFEFEVKNGEMEINFDRHQVRRVLLNIIRNAVEAMPQGGKLKIWTDRNNHKALINIKDTGMGISEEMIDKIFDPFFTTKDIGTGLGLAITQQVINEHGGQIYCKSKIGAGTLFTIELPLN